MKCEQIRPLLAISPREWTTAERGQVEAHLATCPRCAALAREYASQDRVFGKLPRRGLSPERQEAVLAQVRREAGWLRWRVWVSNALGTAAAMLLVLFLGLSLSVLLRHASTATTFLPPTAVSPVPTATPQPTALPRPTPTASITGATPAVPLILVDNGPRSGLGPTEPFPRPDLYTLLGEGNYQVRYRFAERGIYPRPGLGIESPPITAEELAGVRLLIVPWMSCYAAGGGPDGSMVTYDFNLTSEEARVIRNFVANGGQVLFILDPTYRCDFAALSALGILADAGQAVAWNDEAFHPAAGGVSGRSFALAAQYRFQPVRSLSGEAWAQLDGQGALAVEPIGQGRVVVLGLPSLVNGMRIVSLAADQGQPAPLFAADNLAFLVAVVEELTGTPSGLDVEAIAWEERIGALSEGLAHLVERLDAWTPERIAWAVPQGDERQALEAQVAALRRRTAEAVDLLAGWGARPDPARYEAVRGILAEVLEGANQLDVTHGPRARESWEARQARQLRPWLLGFLGGAVLLGIAAWRVRHLDIAPAALARRWAALLPYLVAALLLVVHLLVAADMIGFGLRAGGYPLNRWGVWGYAALTLLAIPIFTHRASGLTRLALPLLATLALMQAHLLTELAGAEYATYRDYEQGIALIANLAVAMAFCLAGVIYRRARWLAAMAGTHLALAAGVMGGSSLLYALGQGFAPWQIYQPLLPPSPLPYLAILYGLGILAARPVRPRAYWGMLVLLLGLFIAGGTILFILGFTWMDSSAPALFDWLNNLLLIPMLLAVGILSAAYWWHARRAARGRLPLVSPLAATVLLLGLAALLMPSLLDPSLLPESGAAMPWRSADYRVPAGAWTLLLPIARVLAATAPWLALLAVLLQLWHLMEGVQGGIAPVAERTRRRLLALAVGYAVLLVAAVTAEMLALSLPHGLWFSPWEDPRVRVLGTGLASIVSLGGLTAWLRRRTGPGRWGGVIYGLTLAVQIPAWLSGLGRLLLGRMSLLLSWLQGMPLSSVGELVAAGLAGLALATLVWHLVVAARVLLYPSPESLS